MIPRRQHGRDLWDWFRTTTYALLGRSRTVGRAAVHIRRASTHQIQHRLVGSIEADRNGEWWFISLIAPQVETAFDVGANVGRWSAEVLRSCLNLRSLSCFDPSEAATIELTAAIGSDPRVRIARAAVSDSEGSIPFYEEDGTSETSSVVAGVSSDAVKRMVRAVTIDHEMEKLSLEHLDLLKIDVEGYDLHALRGARGALTRQAISFVQFEYNEPWMYAGSTLQAAARLLDQCDYELFLLTAVVCATAMSHVSASCLSISTLLRFPGNR